MSSGKSRTSPCRATAWNLFHPPLARYGALTSALHLECKAAAVPLATRQLFVRPAGVDLAAVPRWEAEEVALKQAGAPLVVPLQQPAAGPPQGPSQVEREIFLGLKRCEASKLGAAPG